MALDADRSQAILTHARDELYRHCIVTGSDNPRGLQLKFRPWGECGVEAEFDCRPDFQGYDGILHGGVICSLLDGAAVNCLFVHEVTAVTAALDVRFHKSVITGVPAIVRAWLVRSAHRLLFVAAEVSQDGRVKATAQAKFMLRR